MSVEKKINRNSRTYHHPKLPIRRDTIVWSGPPQWLDPVIPAEEYTRKFDSIEPPKIKRVSVFDGKSGENVRNGEIKPFSASKLASLTELPPFRLNPLMVSVLTQFGKEGEDFRMMLDREYWQEGKSMNELKVRYGVSVTAIARWLQVTGLGTRQRWSKEADILRQYNQKRGMSGSASPISRNILVQRDRESFRVFLRYQYGDDIIESLIFLGEQRKTLAEMAEAVRIDQSELAPVLKKLAITPQKEPPKPIIRNPQGKAIIEQAAARGLLDGLKPEWRKIVEARYPSEGEGQTHAAIAQTTGNISRAAIADKDKRIQKKLQKAIERYDARQAEEQRQREQERIAAEQRARLLEEQQIAAALPWQTQDIKVLLDILPTRARNSIRRARHLFGNPLQTVGDIAQLTNEDLLAIHHCGVMTVTDIRRAIEKIQQNSQKSSNAH